VKKHPIHCLETLGFKQMLIKEQVEQTNERDRYPESKHGKS